MGHLIVVGILVIASYQLYIDVVKLLATAHIVKHRVQVQFGLFFDI